MMRDFSTLLYLSAALIAMCAVMMIKVVAVHVCRVHTEPLVQLEQPHHHSFIIYACLVQLAVGRSQVQEPSGQVDQ
jgi:hypothetical protein